MHTVAVAAVFLCLNTLVQLEFLGTAGYHPSETRHTSCVWLCGAAPEESFVLDAGTGFFRLGTREVGRKMHIFLSHAHLDHVAGLTFLLDVVYQTRAEIALYADAQTLAAVTRELFDSPLFPLAFAYETHTITPRVPFEVAGVAIDTFPLTHPGGSLAFRFRWPDGRSLAYVTDTAGDGLYHGFIEGCDTLIHERNFSDQFAHLADPSGHCTSRAFVAAARAARAGRVIGTHFNPLTVGDPLEEDDVYAQLPGVLAAYDGLQIEP